MHFIGGFPPLPYPAAWRGVLYKIGAKAKEEYILSHRQKSHNKRVPQNSSFAVSRSITGCFAQQNIEEVARSDGRVK